MTELAAPGGRGGVGSGTWWRRARGLIVLLAVLLSAAAFTLIGDGVEDPETGGSLPDGAESSQVDALVAQARAAQPDAEGAPAVVVYRATDGAALTPDQLAALGQGDGPVQPSQDGTVAIRLVPFAPGLADEVVGERIDELREQVAADAPEGVEAFVTGAPAFRADIGKVFEGADVRLLGFTAGVVALLLLITYRSPFLWLVPLTVVGTADQVAARLVNGASSLFGFKIDGSIIGITSVLVFGAGTNYALLLIARYREELHRTENRFDAMSVAVRQAGPAILASSSTVVLALLALSLADTPGTRVLGWAAAIGIVTAVLYALIVLPAALVLFGRRLFWPFVPKVTDGGAPLARGWQRLGDAVTARPVRVVVLGAVLVGIASVGVLGASLGLSQNEQFREKPEAVAGQEVLAASFGGGFAEPTIVFVPAERADAVEQAIAATPGVLSVSSAGAQPGTSAPGGGEYVRLDAVLDADPESAASRATVERLRSELPADALVGGNDAQALDRRDAAASDTLLIIPVILVIVAVILLVLLRSVVAAPVLLATVVATYGASMGLGWLLFSTVLDFPALDLNVPLFAFLFLVALGVDYNIFLALRAREEAEGGAPARRAITTALSATGGVITSAGVLLAAVFVVLGVLPLITLTQLGIIVAVGVLLDTLLVRSVLVPALVAMLGERFWWPRHPAGEATAEPVAEPVG
ncbi:MMPL family transporter [Nocardioides sp.]|uniref:MMPL family transporter n=1 Tax=Nocardioides sp. TaxID=35761 RepID=UPI003516E245